MIKISHDFSFDESEIEITFICSPGPGGQNVNKTATTAVLRFNVLTSPSLPEEVRSRLLNMKNLLTQKGDILIKASSHRTQERNKQDALKRLIAILKQASIRPKKRRKTKPTQSSIERRLTNKKHKSKNKQLRGKPI